MTFPSPIQGSSFPTPARPISFWLLFLLSLPWGCGTIQIHDTHAFLTGDDLLLQERGLRVYGGLFEDKGLSYYHLTVLNDNAYPVYFDLEYDLYLGGDYSAARKLWGSFGIPAEYKEVPDTRNLDHLRRIAGPGEGGLVERYLTWADGSRPHPSVRLRMVSQFDPGSPLPGDRLRLQGSVYPPGDGKGAVGPELEVAGILTCDRKHCLLVRKVETSSLVAGLVQKRSLTEPYVLEPLPRSGTLSWDKVTPVRLWEAGCAPSDLFKPFDPSSCGATHPIVEEVRCELVERGPREDY